MLVFSVSDKGGTGRSVTSCNMAYRLSMDGLKVAYVDFDLGSPTAGGIFEMTRLDTGLLGGGGLHDYLLGESGIPTPLSVRSETSRAQLSQSRHPSGRLVLFPGDRGGSEINKRVEGMLERCIALLTTCEEEYDVTFVDLSAGRSATLELVLEAVPRIPVRTTEARWLVFHRWTRQHVSAAYSLVYGDNGLLKTGTAFDHDEARLLRSLRFVRTAVPELRGEDRGMRAAQAEWLQRQHDALSRTADRLDMGTTMVLGQTPVEPVLQCREQVILNIDVSTRIANQETVDAFRNLSDRLVSTAVWEGDS